MVSPKSSNAVSESESPEMFKMKVRQRQLASEIIVLQALECYHQYDR